MIEQNTNNHITVTQWLQMHTFTLAARTQLRIFTSCFSMISILDLYSTGILHCFGQPWEAPCTGSQGQAHGSWPCVVSAAASPLVLRYRPFLPWLKSWFIPGSDDIEVPWMPWPWRAWITWITWFGWSQLPRYPADPWPWFGWSNHGIHFIVVR